MYLELRSANALSPFPINAPLPETLFRARAIMFAMHEIDSPAGVCEKSSKDWLTDGACL